MKFPKLKKHLGQHILRDSAALQSIVEAAELTPDDLVIEIGSGPGNLSQLLSEKVHRLTCLELDPDMIPLWKVAMSSYPNAEVFQRNALSFIPPLGPYKVVANIPYYISSPLLKHFLRESSHPPSVIVFLIQKEVAQRICDLEKPTLLSWEVRIFGKPEMLLHLPPKSFIPPPKVDSSILKIRIFQKPLIPRTQLDQFFRMLSVAYKQPRKTLLNNLLASGISIGTKLPVKIRPHEMSLDQWELLFRQTFQKQSPDSVQLA